MSGFRTAVVLIGDTVQRLALRELGDATRWVDIALLNELRSPFFVDDPALAGDGVIAAGGTVLLPVEAAVPSGDQDDPFYSDVRLLRGELLVENGDLSLVSGVANLVQALGNRVVVEKRELMFHPEYGCWVSTLLGQVNGPTAGSIAAFYVKSSLLEDDRVRSVDQITADVIGDQIKVMAVVTPTYGESFDFSKVI